MPTKHKLGQYFTTSIELKEKVFEFICNNPDNILEPSIGQGDLVTFIMSKIPDITFDMYEIDTEIKLLDDIDSDSVIYTDFMTYTLTKIYKTIIGNPPYVRTKKGNLYIDFIEKCYNLLEFNGELIFIVPSDFLKLTSASKLLNVMMINGTFTHIYHPHNEKLFENASIDVIVFRYCKNNLIDKKVVYNDKLLYVTNSKGLITFDEKENNSTITFQDYFNIYVGIVCGKEEVYKNEELGNIEVLNGENKIDKYIYIEKYPCDDKKINEHLLQNKQKLIERKIRKFNESNWFEWGALRNINSINNNIDTECIYIYNLTRKSKVAFLGRVNYFGGGLIMLKPKKPCDLTNIVEYLNSDNFKDNFMFSGRFKLGHRQISNSYIPNEIISENKDIEIIIQEKGLKRNTLDKYYTKSNVVTQCIELVKQYVNILNDYLIIEPSAGNGAFIPDIKTLLTNYKFYDLEPENKDICKQDFLEIDYETLNQTYTNIHIIGNPPFGRQASLAIKFVKKCCLFSNSISFILPKSFKKDSMKKAFNKHYHLVHETDLLDNSFLVNDVESDVPCVFQIWIRREEIRNELPIQKPLHFEFVKKTINQIFHLEE